MLLDAEEELAYMAPLPAGAAQKTFVGGANNQSYVAQPYRIKLPMNSIQKGASPVNPTSRPDTSRSPALATPTPITRAMGHIRAL